jgi:hypothetical protein
MPERLTSGLAQAGVWLARKFVGIFNIYARANGSETPAFAKPPPRCAEIPSGFRRIVKLPLLKCTQPFGTSCICWFCKRQNPSQSQRHVRGNAAKVLKQAIVK